jgi:hypothetical protein
MAFNAIAVFPEIIVRYSDGRNRPANIAFDRHNPKSRGEFFNHC